MTFAIGNNISTNLEFVFIILVVSIYKKYKQQLDCVSH